MKRGKIVSSDLTRIKIQEALRKKPSQPSKSPTPNEINANRSDVKRKTIIPGQNVVTNKLQRPRVQQVRRPTTQFLTTVPNKMTKLALPEKGSFNAGILDLDDKILCVYRPDEVQLIACFLNNDLSIIPDSFTRFSLIYAADPRLIRTPDNKVLMSYSKFEPHNSNEHIDGNIIMDLDKSRDQIFLSKTFRISPTWMKNRQKNWMPFTHGEKLYFIATVCPHAIYEFDWKSKTEAKAVYSENWHTNWFLREPHRGNTNAVLLPDGNYLSTFHTAMNKSGCHFYDNGAYIFEGNPPFRPIMSGAKTYLRAEAAKEPHFRKEGLIICTFPIGMILRDEKLLISYGDNDSCVKIMETTVADMKNTMLPVERIKTKENFKDHIFEDIKLI